MTQVFHFFAVSLGLAAALAAVAIWSPRALATKLGALAITTLFVPVTYFSMSELLSRPKPVALEWARGASEARVLGSDLREGESIFLWVRVPDSDEPRAYRLPWDKKLAEQLHKAQREAAQDGTDVRAKNLFQSGPKDDQKPVFYARPQQALPPKVTPSFRPYVFDSGIRPGAQGGG